MVYTTITTCINIASVTFEVEIHDVYAFLTFTALHALLLLFQLCRAN